MGEMISLVYNSITTTGLKGAASNCKSLCRYTTVYTWICDAFRRPDISFYSYMEANFLDILNWSKLL